MSWTIVQVTWRDWKNSQSCMYAAPLITLISTSVTTLGEYCHGSLLWVVYPLDMWKLMPMIIWLQGSEGYKNSRKGTTFAAQATGLAAAHKAQELGFRRVRVKLRGPGLGRQVSLACTPDYYGLVVDLKEGSNIHTDIPDKSIVFTFTSIHWKDLNLVVCK